MNLSLSRHISAYVDVWREESRIFFFFVSDEAVRQAIKEGLVPYSTRDLIYKIPKGSIAEKTICY